MAEESQNSTPPPPPTDKQDPPPPAESNPTLQNQKEERPPPADKVDSSQPPVDLESTTTTTAEKEKLPPPRPAAAEENRSLAAMMEKESTSSPAAAAENINEDVVAEAGKEKPPENDNEENRKIPETLVSFKEESNVVADLSNFERKALQELKQLIQDALTNRQLISSSPSPPPPPPPNKEEDKDKQTSESDKSTEITKPQEQAATQQSQETAAGEEVVSIWGVPLLKDDRSDVILLKFLRARDFKVSDAFLMIKNTLQWRKDFGIDSSLLDEDLGDDLDKVVFMHGYDREGHPVCYNVYGEFQNKVLYHNTFSDEDKRLKFLRWRIQFLEKGIRKLDFRPGGVSTIFQVNDLKNSPGPGKRELRIATRQALQLLQDNYPEFVAKQVFINVPWWYLAFYTMISPFMTQRTKSKFVFAGPSKSAEILFKYISPEHVPIQYGGLSVDYCDCNPEFTIDDPATEITVKPGTKQNVEIIIYEKCTIVWEIRVVGWEVSYGAEFVPDAKDRYTIIIHKPTKLSTTDEPVVSHKFKVEELGKVLLTVDNPTSKKKKLLYRFKVEAFSN